MQMKVTQVRLPVKLIEKVDQMVEEGFYHSRSDLLREAIRKTVLEKHIGIIKNQKDSVKEIKAIRKKLSKRKINLKEINSLND